MSAVAQASARKEPGFVDEGRRLIQAAVWRNDKGVWRAGVWTQCIDRRHL
jgi:hypothetical protein